jgi:hypothetical protein
MIDRSNGRKTSFDPIVGWIVAGTLMFWATFAVLITRLI